MYAAAFDLGNLGNEAKEAMVTRKEQGVPESKEPEKWSDILSWTLSTHTWYRLKVAELKIKDWVWDGLSFKKHVYISRLCKIITC